MRYRLSPCRRKGRGCAVAGSTSPPPDLRIRACFPTLWGHEPTEASRILDYNSLLPIGIGRTRRHVKCVDRPRRFRLRIPRQLCFPGGGFPGLVGSLYACS
jgi:hypothetical protein